MRRGLGVWGWAALPLLFVPACSCESVPSMDAGPTGRDAYSADDAYSPFDARGQDAYSAYDAYSADDARSDDAPWPFDANGCVPRVEMCNGVDENCDGMVDDGALCDPGLMCLGGECRAGGVASWIQVLPTTDARGVAVDSMGRITVVGCIRGTVTMAGHTYVAGGSADAFALQLAADGTAAWAQKYGGGAPDTGECANAVAAWPVDDRVVIAGDFAGTTTFGSGGVAASTGGLDGFAVALDHNGVWVWERLFSNGPSDQLSMTAVTFDGDGAVYVGGRATGQIRPSGDVFWPMDSAGDGFLYLLHRDDGVPDGVPTRFSSSGADGVTALDWEGRSVLVGGFAGAAMDFGVGSVAYGGGAADALVWVLDTGSSMYGGRLLGGPADDRILAGAFSTRANVAVGGTFAQELDLGGGVRRRRGTSQEAFVTQESGLDLAWRWDAELGAALTNDAVTAIAPDGGAGVYVGGVSNDVPFLRHYDIDGALIWERTFGTAGTGVGVHGIARAPEGAIVVVGVMNGTITEGTVMAVGPGAFIASLRD